MGAKGEKKRWRYYYYQQNLLLKKMDSQRVSEKLGEKAKKRNWESKGKKEVSYFREIHRR